MMSRAVIDALMDTAGTSGMAMSGLDWIDLI